MEYKFDFYWGTEPTELVVDSSVLLKSHFNVLDLGCGEGRNSFFIKERVSKLTSVDISSDALSKLIELSINKKLNIKTYESDALDFMQKSENYDVIYCINLFQRLNQTKIINL
jgi:tellurite methyltransferase